MYQILPTANLDRTERDFLNAVRNGCDGLVKRYYHQGVNIRCRTTDSETLDSYEAKAGMTAVHLAAWYGHDFLVNFLVDRGCPVDSEDFSGFRPIHFACAQESLLIMSQMT
ncbi:ankyrin repeat domain-containing protein 65-like [Symsagittifera roscoffensis]|uniref:ankyrin repeat domain-containing protein 65-like n=1 Tax=Symsagittifera roscoffensis TaxID=84072 RepID=UPI00307C2D4D